MTTMPDPRQQRRAALLAEIPEDERLAFESYYAERLQSALQEAHVAAGETLLGAADPYEVEAALLEMLIRETDGRADAEGLGLVPTADQECWIEVPDRDPREVTPARGGARGLGEGTVERKNQVIAAVIGVVGALLFLQSLLPMFRGNATNAPTLSETSTASTTTPVVDLDVGTEVQFWYPTSLEFLSDGASTVLRVVASDGALGGSWTPELSSGVANWLRGTYVNSIFCLPPELDGMLQAAQPGQPIILRPANGARRTYVVLRVRRVPRQQTELLEQNHAGMTLIACGVDSAERTVVEASFQPDAVRQHTGRLGEPLALGEFARVIVQGTEVVTTTTTLPEGTIALAVHAQFVNTGESALELRSLTDQLTIDGQMAGRQPTSLPVALASGGVITTTFHYTIPETGGQARWQVVTPAGEQVAVTWLAPSTPRRSALLAILTPTDIGVKQLGGQLWLVIQPTVRASGDAPITIDAGAVEVSSNGRPLILAPESMPFPLTVAPGSEQRLSLVVPLPFERTVLVRIGSQRWHVTVPASLQ